MSRHRRLLAAALTGLLAVTTAGCGGSGETSNELVIQSLWTKGTAEGKALQLAIDRFSKDTGTKVRLIDTGESLADVYETTVAAGNQADVVLTNLAEKSVDWVKNGAVVPMDDHLKGWGMESQLRPEAVQEWRDTDGALIGLPFTGFTWPVWYNTALLKKAGVAEPPKTTDELIDAAKKLRAAGIAPMSVGGNDWSGQKVFLQIAQSYMDAKSARAAFAKGGYCANPAMMKGIELFVRLRDAGVFIDDAQGFSAEAMNNQYYTGKAAILSAGSWAFNDLPDEVKKTTVLSGFPLVEGSPYAKPIAMRGFTGTGLLMSSKGADKADKVQQFAKVLYSPDIIRQFVSTAALIPAVSGDATKATDPLMRQAVEELDARVDYAVMPDTAVPGAVSDPMIRATSIAYSPGKNAAAICGEIDAAYEAAS
ncbi:extracellular solute-binding protein [Streptosporangium sp. KLBMP 9127]|nr:extracellular solute-binding protein [Streptosporangium sp. KLBMP 9127]